MMMSKEEVLEMINKRIVDCEKALKYLCPNDESLKEQYEGRILELESIRCHLSCIQE